MAEKCPLCDKKYNDFLGHIRIEHDSSSIEEYECKVKENEDKKNKIQALFLYIEELRVKHRAGKISDEEFMKKYHLRSNVESGFSMIKSRFGDFTYMKDEVGAMNDVLIKILCHNLCVLCQELILLGIDINFAQHSEMVTQDGI